MLFLSYLWIMEFTIFQKTPYSGKGVVVSVEKPHSFEGTSKEFRSWQVGIRPQGQAESNIHYGQTILEKKGDSETTVEMCPFKVGQTVEYSYKAKPNGSYLNGRINQKGKGGGKSYGLSFEQQKELSLLRLSGIAVGAATDVILKDEKLLAAYLQIEGDAKRGELLLSATKKLSKKLLEIMVENAKKQSV